MFKEFNKIIIFHLVNYITYLVYNSVMSSRHEYREKIVFALYQHLLLHKNINDCFIDNFEDDDNEFVSIIKEDLLINEDKYIDEISKYLNKFTFNRLNLVEQAILLETVSELKLKLNEKAVIINEAIILCKEYCDEQSYKYINGVLDKIC